MLRFVRHVSLIAFAALVTLPALAQESAGDFKAQLGPDRAKSTSAATPAVFGGALACTGGSVAGYACDGVDLLSFTPLSSIGTGIGQELSDIWGWTDPETGQEWAIVARTDGTAFVDVTDAENPRYAGQVPLALGGRANFWRDVKVYQNHAYIVADNAGNIGMQVFDMTTLRGVSDDPIDYAATLYTGFGDAHNIAINEDTGFAYAIGLNGANGNPCGPGMHIVDLSTPGTPTFAGCFSRSGVGRSNTGYVHDTQCVIYDGPDADYTGREICFNSSETDINIIDITDKDAIVDISVADYPSARYIHQGWLTRDQRYFIQNDELDQSTSSLTRTFVWDVQDLDDPVLVKTYESALDAIDHNLYIKGNLVFQANYTSGLRLLDITDPTDPTEVGFFDTTPNRSGVNFNGAWSVYPYFESGSIIVSSIGEGLFVLKLDDALSVTSADSADERPSSLRFETVFPNPVSEAATLSLDVVKAGPVEIVVYDATGRRVATLHDGVLPEGSRSFVLDASALTPGTYLVRATAGAAQATRSVTVVR